MKILILGSGAREHALAHTFYRQDHAVYCLPGNSGIQEIAETIQDVDENDFEQVCNVAIRFSVDLTVAASEKFLTNGIADIFKKNNLKFFGPVKKAAIIESSKAWSKNFMQNENIPTSKFIVSSSLKDAKKQLLKIFKEGLGVVIKPDGLTAGKGVMVCDTISEANLAIDLIMKDKYFSSAGNKIVIEERLVGEEVSVMAFCDGKKAYMMLPAQDYKRLYEAAKGPNTGGMGAYAPVPFLDRHTLQMIQEKVFDRTMQGLIKNNIEYVGVLYAGLMISGDSINVLEFNCRFGDPETQAVLPLLKSDLYSVMKKCINNRFDEEIHWDDRSACCVVMASRGYPNTYQTGFEISGLNDQIEGTYIFHAGTKRSYGSPYMTAGGRVLSVCAFDSSLEAARQKAYKQVRKIKFKGAHYRKDIANKTFKLCPS